MNSIKLFISDFIIELFEVDSKSEMYELLKLYDDNKYYAPEPESYNRYAILRYRKSNNENWFAIGICFAEYENYPTIIYTKITDNILILYGNDILMFDMTLKKPTFSYHSCIPLVFIKSFESFVIVITEASIMQMDFKGHIIKEEISDFILTYHFTETKIIYETDNGERIFYYAVKYKTC